MQAGEKAGAEHRSSFDDLEQVIRWIIHGNLHVGNFSQFFALGNLPVMCGITRPINTHPSFTDIFNSAVCL